MKIYPVTFNNNFRTRQVRKNNNSGTPANLLNSDYSYQTSPANSRINFKSLKATDGDENLFLDTAFYRDFSTLIGVARLIQETFPNGADIMDFACSNGEEAISLHSLINDNKNDDNKYKIYCYDTSDKALKLAKNNIYMVHNALYDSFLIDDKTLDPMYDFIKNRFYQIMEEVPAPKLSLLGETFDSNLNSLHVFNDEKYFRVKDKYRNNFKFQKGDIRNIANIQPDKQVGAVFFRNALYHLTNNHPFGRIYDEETLNKIWNTNKEEVLEDIVDKVYDKLLPGGFFVLGTDEKEHVYQADKFTPKDEIFFDEMNNEYLRIKSPLLKALHKDDRFTPVISAKCYTRGMGDFTVYTVWQKTAK